MTHEIRPTWIEHAALPIALRAMAAGGCGAGRASAPGAVAAGPGAASSLAAQSEAAGGRIAFHTDRDLDFELHVMNAARSDVRQLTDHPAADALVLAVGLVRPRLRDDSND